MRAPLSGFGPLRGMHADPWVAQVSIQVAWAAAAMGAVLKGLALALMFAAY
jgi:hypothetical protein